MALTGIHRLDEPGHLKGWLTSIAVHQARALIRKRSRRRILRFVDPVDLREEVAPPSGAEHYEVMRALYRVLEGMPADERIAFALRFVDGMELTEVASACGVSRATICRRLERAERHFSESAREHEALAGWLEKGSRWNP
jgi:RNA polymerase sigma-70 factor (ECF subfamily)